MLRIGLHILSFYPMGSFVLRVKDGPDFMKRLADNVADAAFPAKKTKTISVVANDD